MGGGHLPRKGARAHAPSEKKIECEHVKNITHEMIASGKRYNIFEDREAKRLRIEMKDADPDDLVEVCKHMCDCVKKAKCSSPEYLVHLRVLPGKGIPPDPPCLLKIAGLLLEVRPWMTQNIIATCLQVPFIDETTKMVQNIFLSLYTPAAPFYMVETDEEREHFYKTEMDKLSAKPAEKQ